ncbi:capsular polysaccharide biosynthesis protein [Aestuariivita boseongensis]|uniref:capsular polysaccharide biosynthesis protein n=1 Tax=Aestuariivita boseongensis TaxID=1470562 RepID=UPI00067FB487|nr:capsular polysaccharide biosynthesis protein [Aestuariivita boseongensis]
MSPDRDQNAAGEGSPRRLFVYNGGFLTQPRLKRILSLAGYQVRIGAPGPGDMVGVWGASPTSHRGLGVAERRDAPVLRVEDAFLRSLHPGRAGEPPIGLHLDRSGVHFDASTPSDLERLLADAPLDDTVLLDRARNAMARIKEADLSKYNAHDPALPVPDPGYVLVIDQTEGDASVTASGADKARFREMLVYAQEQNPGAQILIKSHPETEAGFRPGHFDAQDESDRVRIYRDPVSPWALLDGAIGVYTVSSQLGFEAILAGHTPRVFGAPFYAGWGLTIDHTDLPRRARKLTKPQLFAAAMILYPTWYDPFTDSLCELERVLDILEAQVDAFRTDRDGWVASEMRLWKRKPLQSVFGQQKKMIFEDRPDRARASGRPWMVWAGKATADHAGAVRVEDGFLRSRGLGAELVPPLSLVLDDLGIYYDPTQPSRLEHWIAEREVLRPDQRRRARDLIGFLTASRLTKYNLSGGLGDIPQGHRVLVPGQVEDDASILKGTGEVCTNLALLEAARAARPDAVLIYKPHPDVEAGLRKGKIDASGLADVIADQADIAQLLDQVDEVWTMTSGTGFEALLRGVTVTTLGAPFYAGWGLTTDLGPVPDRRTARPDLEGLVHAVLIDYARYFDPVTGQACPVEVVAERLASATLPRRGVGNRLLAKLQGGFATYAHLWR